MRRIALALLLILVGLPCVVSAQETTETPESTPTITPSPTPEPAVYATMLPVDGEPNGQMTRFDYVVSAGDVHIANLMTWLLYSLWGMFLFAVLVLLARYRKR